MKLWKDVDFERERRGFIKARKNHVSMWGVSLAFAVVFAVTWLSSWLLLNAGMQSMPLRYAINILIGYGAFFCVIRVWADYQKKHPSERHENSDLGSFDLLGADGEGCLFVIALIAIGFLIAGLFMWVGTSLLLEVAFEVAFAGALVRRMGHIQEVGNWHIVLFQKTYVWLVLLVAVVCSGAYFCQNKYPGAVNMSGVWKQWKAEK
jgi:hypothetical protein